MENRRSIDTRCRVLRVFSLLAAAAVMIAFLTTAGGIFVKGIPEFTSGLFSYIYTERNFSLFPSLIGTFYMTAGVLLIAAPLGGITGLWLSGFSLEDRTYRIISTLIDCLNGMPSILYGLYGFLFFVVFMGIGYSLLSGILVLIILILPMIIRISEKAFRSVFCMYRETGEALGISRVSMLRHVVMPQAFPDITAGIILSAARISGSAAALLYTSGTVAQIPGSLMDSGRTLAVHVYLLSSEDTEGGSVYAAMVILVLITGILNELAFYIIGRRKHE